MEIWQSRFVHGRNVWRNRNSCTASNRVRLKISAANLLKKVRHRLHLQISVTSQEVLQRRPPTPIGHKLKACVRFPLKEDPGNVTHSANTRVSLRSFIGVRLQPSD